MSVLQQVRKRGITRAGKLGDVTYGVVDDSELASQANQGIDLVGADSPAGRRMAGHAGFIEFLTAEMPAIMARWDALSQED